jgi:hypothetical protein
MISDDFQEVVVGCKYAVVSRLLTHWLKKIAWFDTPEAARLAHEIADPKKDEGLFRGFAIGGGGSGMATQHNLGASSYTVTSGGK